MTQSKTSPQLRIAWIPLVLALMAMLGVNASRANAASTSRKSSELGVEVSVATMDIGAIGRVTDPLDFVATTTPTEPLLHHRAWTFLKREAGQDVESASLRQGAPRGRAPPVVA